jgi:ubiquinone/menaquinone biosynthesis methyltransferase
LELWNYGTLEPRAPLGAAFDSPESKRRYVRRLFATIADRYDLITAVLSYGQDARWKALLVREAAVTPNDRALDLACGTGDIASATAAAGALTVGLDVTLRMLEIANAKQQPASPKLASLSGASGGGPVRYLCGDMTALPFQSQTFDLVTTGYGLRNVPDLDSAIGEIARVLRSRGRLLSLDFNRLRSPIVRAAYLTYLTIVGSTLGWILHRDPDTYRYIPESIKRYPGAEGVAELLRARGFKRVRIVPLLWGLMTLHIAYRD